MRKKLISNLAKFEENDFFRKPEIDLSGGIVGKFEWKCQLDIADFKKSEVYIRDAIHPVHLYITKYFKYYFCACTLVSGMNFKLEANEALE